MNAGTLIVSGQPYFNVGRITTIASGAILELFNSTNNFTTQMPASTVNGSGTLRFSGNSTLNQTLNGTPNQRRLTLSQGAGGVLDLQGTSSILNGGWQNINWAGNNGSLNIASGASLDMWDGVAVRIDALTGAGTINKGNGGSINLTLGVNGGSGTFSGTIGNSSGTVTITKNGAGTQIFTGNNSYSGTTTISGGTLQIGNGGTTGTLGSGSVTNNAALVFNRSNAMSVANVISGSGSVTQSGTGTTTLTGNNTYLGGSNLNAGILNAGSTGAIGSSGTISFGGGTLQYSPSNATDYSNRFNTGASQLRSIDTNGRNVTYATILGGAGSTLTKLGTGTLTLSGANTYTGATTVNAGTLLAGVATSAFGSNSATTVASGATLDLNGLNNTIGSLAGAGTVTNSNATGATLTTGGNGTSTTFSGILQNGTGTAALTKTGAGTMTLAGNNSYSGTTTISAGTLQVGNGGTTGTLGSAGVTNNAALAFNRSDAMSVANVISGSGSVSQSGTGTTTLSGNNTYTGTTTINGGTLRLGAADRIANASALSIGASGTFDLNNFSETLASVTNNGAVTMGSGNTLTTTNAQTHTGTISGGTVSLVSTAGGAISANNILNDFTGALSLSTTGAASVVDVNALTLSTVSASTLSARALGGNLTLGGNITATGAGDAIILDASDMFSNAGNFTLSPGTGRYLIFNGNTTSASINKGGLIGFNRYGCTYNSGAPSCAAGTDIPATGNGFYFAFAPTISLSGVTANSKIFDGTISATLTGTPVASGAVNGDTVTIDSSAVTANFADSAAGTAKPVTVTGYTQGGTKTGYIIAQPTGLSANITAAAASPSGGGVFPLPISPVTIPSPTVTPAIINPALPTTPNIPAPVITPPPTAINFIQIPVSVEQVSANASALISIIWDNEWDRSTPPTYSTIVDINAANTSESKNKDDDALSLWNGLLSIDPAFVKQLGLDLDFWAR